MMDGPDHRDPVGDALFGGSKSKEVSETLVLEVGPVKGPEWGVDVKVAIKGDGKVGIMEASGHVVKFLWGRGVYVEVMCVQGDIHQHDRIDDNGSRVY